MKGCLQCTRNLHVCYFHEYPKAQSGIFHYSHFTVEETEIEKGHVTEKIINKLKNNLEMKTKLEEAQE